MASLDYRLNPLFTIKECSSCGSLYNKGYCCTPNSSQQPLRDCPKCGNPVEGPNCQGCALWRKKLKEVWFTICHENGIYQDLLNTYESSDDDTNIANAPRKPFVVKQDPDENSFTYDSKPNSVNDSPNVFNPPPMYFCEFCGNDACYGHYCTPQVPFIYLGPCYNQDFNFQQDFHDFQQQYLCCENCGGPHETFQCQPMNEDYYHEQNSCYDSNSFGFDQFQPPQYTVNHPIFNAQNELLNSQNKLMEQMTSICDMIPICYNDDDDEYSSATQEYLKKFSSAITPDLPKSDSLIMEDEHLDTIPKTESDELIKSSVEDLVHTPSESDGISEGECDLPIYDDFSLKKDEVLDDIISIPPGNGNDHFNAESSLIESVLNHDNVISFPKIHFLIEEFASELALIAPNPPGIVKADLDPKEDIRFIENLMYDNSFSSPSETLKDDYEIVIDSNDDSTSSDDDSDENIDYVHTSPPDAEIVSLEVVETLKDNPTPSSDFVTKSSSTFPNSFLEEIHTFDNSLPGFETFCFDLEENSSGSTTALSDYSLPNYEAFYLDDDHIEEKSSGSTTTHADFSQYDSFIFDLLINPFPRADRSDFYHEEFVDELAHIISPPEYDCFYFKSEAGLGELTSIVDSGGYY
ncbi:hypothetical protein Tco_1225968 [Tanacetum coccineum]